MKRNIYAGIGIIIAAVVFILAQIAFALQVPNIGDYDNDGDLDFVMSQIVQQQNSTTFYEMNPYYGIYPVNATYGFFIDLNKSNDYLDVYLVYENHPNKLLLYNGSFFIDITASAGVGGDASDAIGANTFDFNGDNNSDLFANSRLYLGYGNGSFRDVTNESNLAELPRLKAIIPWDFNEDNLTDIFGLSENGSEVFVMINMDDNDGDNIPEFWDASVLSQLSDLTKSDLSASIANSAAVGATWNWTYNISGNLYPHFVSGIYLPRNGIDILLDTYPSSAFTLYVFSRIPEFRWLNVSALFTGNLTSVLGNSTDAYFADIDDNNASDIVVAGSITFCVRNGIGTGNSAREAGSYPLGHYCYMSWIFDEFGEGLTQDTPLRYIRGMSFGIFPNFIAVNGGGGNFKGDVIGGEAG